MKSKTVSETRTKWLQFGAVSETWGLAFPIRMLKNEHSINLFEIFFKRLGQG